MLDRVLSEIREMKYQFFEEIDDINSVRVLSKLKDETRQSLSEEIEYRKIGLEVLDEIIFRLSLLEEVRCEELVEEEEDFGDFDEF